MLSVWPKIIDWFQKTFSRRKCRDDFHIFSICLYVWVCESFGKCFCTENSSFFLFVAASARSGIMYHYHHCAFLSRAARLVAVNLHTISGLGCLERKRTPSRNEKTSARERIVYHWCRLLFTSVIKCHYQVFFLCPLNRVFFVYCYLYGCFNIK